MKSIGMDAEFREYRAGQGRPGREAWHYACTNLMHRDDGGKDN